MEKENVFNLLLYTDKVKMTFGSKA